MVAGNPFVGRWVNKLGYTASWVRLDIAAGGEAWTIRVWADPDVQNERLWREWEERYAGVPDHKQAPFDPPLAATLRLLADDVCDTEMRYGFASRDVGFADEHLTLRLDGDDLVADTYTLFKDGSGRSNVFTRDVFTRVPLPSHA
jgi:hypothetical protein